VSFITCINVPFWSLTVMLKGIEILSYSGGCRNLILYSNSVMWCMNPHPPSDCGSINLIEIVLSSGPMVELSKTSIIIS